MALGDGTHKLAIKARSDGTLPEALVKPAKW
jgi:hypothetical protein